MFKAFKESVCFALNTKRYMLITCIAVLCITSVPQASAEMLAGWSFDCDQVNYDASNGHQALIQYGASVVTDAERGKVVEFSDYNGRIYLYDTIGTTDSWLQNALATQVTMMFWAKFGDSWPVDDWLPQWFWKANAYGLGRGPFSTEQFRYVMQTDFEGLTTYAVGTGTDPNDPAWTDLADGQWHHYAVVADTNGGSGGFLTLYIDGVEKDSTSIEGNGLRVTNPGIFGNAPTPGNKFDEAGFFDEPLVAGPLDGSEKGTINYYRVHGLFARTFDRMVAYPLDTDFSDVSGNGRNGIVAWADPPVDPNLVADPNFVTDAERGEVLYMDGDFSISLPFTNSENNWLQDALVSDFTIMMWGKMDGDFNDILSPTLFSKGLDYLLQRGVGGSTDMAWSARDSNFVDPTYAVNARITTPIDDGQWHHFAVAHAGGLTRIYLDGESVDIDGYIPEVSFARNTYSARIGSQASAASGNWVGWLDDIAIFDVGLDTGLSDGSVPGTINWYRVNGVEPSCDDVLALGYSQPFDMSGVGGTPDCYVNFYDFSVLSQNWLDTLGMADLTAMAEVWLDCIDPGDPLCETVY